MEFSWLDELVSSEKVFGSQLITEVKSNLQTPEAEQIMETLVEYKKEYLLVEQIWEASEKIAYPKLKDQWAAEREAAMLIRKHTRRRDAFYRMLIVLMRGEETVKEAERQNEETWKKVDKYIWRNV
jgi:hypothetical protein